MRAVLPLVFLCSVAGPASSQDKRVGEVWEAEFQGVTYEVYTVEPAKVELHWRNEQGQRYARFDSLEKALVAKGKRVEFMMNAGIFEPGGIPSGLHVEKGVQLRPLNLKQGKGNFYLQPNGVFCILPNGSARVVTSAEYAQAKVKPRLALQSGPLLLRKGRIHTAFNADSPNKLRRNGVGVDKEGRVVFAITSGQGAEAQKTNLHGFASFFLSLECDDALFLDGVISLAALHPREPLKPVNAFGAILAVTSEAEAAAK